MSVAKLARLTGLNDQGLRNLYHRKTKQIEFETIDKICTALDISIGELFEHIKKND